MVHHVGSVVVREVQAPSGGAGDPTLRQWWRGRVGLSKQEQTEYFQAALKDIEDLGAA